MAFPAALYLLVDLGLIALQFVAEARNHTLVGEAHALRGVCPEELLQVKDRLPVGLSHARRARELNRCKGLPGLDAARRPACVQYQTEERTLVGRHDLRTYLHDE